jgi:hypothetical protein
MRVEPQPKCKQKLNSASETVLTVLPEFHIRASSDISIHFLVLSWAVECLQSSSTEHVQSDIALFKYHSQSTSAMYVEQGVCP